MTKIDEIAPDVYRISIYVTDFNLQFNHFLVKDIEPLLFHTGFKAMFPLVRDSVSAIINPSEIRWIGFSHFESDECGSLNQWLELAPNANVVCSVVGALVNLGDFAARPPKGMKENDLLSTGKYQFRFYHTPHLPHGWDAGVLFEETSKTLFCSDLFHQIGDVKALTEADVVEPSRSAMIEYQGGPLMNYMPYTPNTKRLLQGLAALKPRTLAIMHGSSFVGNGEQALLDLDVAMKEVFGKP
jgi:flavorubredoxin